MSYDRFFADFLVNVLQLNRKMSFKKLFGAGLILREGTKAIPILVKLSCLFPNSQGFPTLFNSLDLILRGGTKAIAILVKLSCLFPNSQGRPKRFPSLFTWGFHPSI